MQRTLHELRKQVDACIQAVDSWKVERGQQMTASQEQVKCQREIALAYTKLQEAKMWLGKCLEVIGSELPKEFQDKAE